MVYRGTMAAEPVRKDGERPTDRPDPEVEMGARRRRFSDDYKQRVVAEADACEEPGEVGALLRREGLYSSHLFNWRRQLQKKGLSGLAPQKRGPRGRTAEEKRVQELERENARLKAQLQRAEKIIDFQKKVSEILEIRLDPTAPDGTD